jgi:hypothetical protein
MTAQTYNPMRSGGSQFQASLGKKFKRDVISTNAWLQWHKPVIPAEMGNCGSRPDYAKKEKSL